MWKVGPYPDKLIFRVTCHFISVLIGLKSWDYFHMYKLFFVILKNIFIFSKYGK
jgi:hypothetical protein